MRNLIIEIVEVGDKDNTIYDFSEHTKLVVPRGLLDLATVVVKAAKNNGGYFNKVEAINLIRNAVLDNEGYSVLGLRVIQDAIEAAQELLERGLVK